MLKLYYKKRGESLNHRLQDQQQRVRAQSEMAAAQTMIPSHLSHQHIQQNQQQTSGLLPSTHIHGNEQLLSSSGPTREEVLSAQVQSLQEQIQNMAMTNAMNRPPTGMSHAISQPSIHNDLMYPGTSPLYRPPMQHDPHQMYAMPYGYPPQQPQQPPPSIYDQQPYAMPHQQQQQSLPPQAPPSYYSPMRYGTQTLPHHNSQMSYSMYEPQQLQTSISPQNHHLYGGQSFDDYHQHHLQQQQQQQMIPNANNTFHLHQANASNSRLDPPLELNRNLTNWGLTYRAQTRTPRKTWAEFKNLRPLQSSQSTMAMHEAITPIRRRPSTPKYENGSAEKSPAAGFTIKDTPAAVDMTPEMQAKRNALYANLMKRKEKIADKVEEKEAQYSEKREAERAKQEAAEQRKIETEFRRQKLLEEYKRKKLEKEFPDLAAATSSPNMSARSNSNLQRGHSQPPFVQLGKSQSNMHEIQSRSTPRTSRAKSNAGDENSTPRLLIPSTAEPSLKLFSKHVPKSNRSLIVNALQYSIFPGAVSSDQRNKVQEALAQSDSKHFLLLFRDHKCQYRGLYTWDGASDTAHKVHGMGPKIVREDMMSMMFKYDSGSKHFNKIPAKHLSPTIDGFLIHDQLWQKPKIPHSGAR
uniref:CKK domain-containing protein n=1 Tax=Panagrolaimus sp. ES5 TaxID=591445 RepID=A0AC34GPL2_9BILA